MDAAHPDGRAAQRVRALTGVASKRVAAVWAVARPHRTALLIALGVLGAGLWFGPSLLLGPQVAVREVIQRDFVQTVVASGHVETPHRVSIGAQITGTVKRVPVAEGQIVKAGQVLVELESAEWQAATAQAEVAVAQAQARLRQLSEVQAPVAQQALRQAEVSLANARTQWRRSVALEQQGFIGSAALDDARKAVDLAEAQHRAAQTQLRSAQPSGSDYAVAATALAQARASADAARSRLHYATIVAPAAGTLIDRMVEPGDVVQPGKALMVLSPAGDAQVVVQIDEKNLHLLALGQPARASADAYPEQRLAARLVYINPGIDAQRGSVEVKLALLEAPGHLAQDMTVSVDIEVAARSHAVLVPADAVQDADAAQPWVLKVDGRTARRQNLRLGLRSDGLCEVLDGLRAGDRVVPASSLGIADGSRLRPVAAAGAR
jgi:HlyD family secretion protein